jgi:hypothetical protein
MAAHARLLENDSTPRPALLDYTGKNLAAQQTWDTEAVTSSAVC